MPSADDRIVSMKFDNAEFERKIKTTMDSLAQLDKALKFSGASKGLTDVNDAVKKISFDGMSSGIEDVSKKFIALSTIAITTLVNITERAISAGVQIAKSLTIAPIVDGFHEYETQLNSVQTILANTANKGTTLDQVNNALQQLNTYSDQTIYNFGQMARNIGTFTAAGVDLDTSVLAIKGIANLAALSGSSAEQASSAMYQLSQAIATGTLRLIDWNSVNSAGIGGEVFQNALFESGKALKTLGDIPMTETFTEWKNAGNSFRDSLQDGWITADVLNTTLAGFTGDLTEEMLISKGFSQDAATQIIKTAAIAKAAATEVKTFTQLIGTVKEAVGSGWTETFQLIIGNFTQAKALWTGVNNSIGTFVQNNANARNAIIGGWALFNGRTELIDSFRIAFQALGDIIRPITEAFRNIFPAQTSQNLLDMTDAFHKFAESLIPSQITIDKIRIIAQGLFSALSIGWTIVKEGTKFLIDLGKSLLHLVSPEATDFLVKIGLGLSDLQGALVKGEGIKHFFETLSGALQKPLAFLQKAKDALKTLFDGFSQGAADKVEGAADRLGSRFENLKAVFDKLGDIWKPLESALKKIVDVLGNIWDYVSNWFQELGQRLANVMGPGDFDSFLDILNTSLFGGIVLLFRKFVNKGLKIDLGGGIVEKITGVFGQLTSTLQNMQLQVKANVLLKIAEAIAILTASVVVLSLIDSEALGKALTAMAVGFTQLMASFSVFTKMASTPASAASFTILSVGLGSLATALLILSGVVTVLSKMNLTELGKGLGGVAAMLLILTVASKPLAANSEGLIAAGVGIAAMSVGLAILAIPMKIFSKMKWEEIGKGLAAIGALLAMIVAVAFGLGEASASLVAAGAGIVLLAIGLNILIVPMKVFSKMSWEEIGKGLVGVGGALLIIAAAMQAMPLTLPITAAGLILVGIGLTEIAGAMKIFGTMKWDEIGRGLTVLAGTLLLLNAAMIGMTVGVFGAVAILVIANALVVLAGVLKVFSKLDFGTVLESLAKIAIVLLGFGILATILAPATLSMLALGAALLVLGAGFALAGVGAYLIAKAFQTFAKAGAEGIQFLKDFISLITESLPKLAKALAKAVVGMAQVFLKAAPVFAKMIGKLVDNLLDALIPIIPKAVAVFGELIDGILLLVRTRAPDIISTGLFVLDQFLTGIRDNIGHLTQVAIDIIANFVQAIADNLDKVVDAVANVFINFFTSVAEALGRVSETILIDVGIAFIKGFMDGVEQSANSGPLKWFGELAGNVLTWIGDVVSTLFNKGVDFITGLFNGITNKIQEVAGWLGALPGNILTWVGDTASTLLSKGFDVIEGLFRGITSHFLDVASWIGNVPSMIFNAITGLGDLLFDKGVRVIEGFWKGMKSIWDNVTGWISNAMSDIADTVGGVLGINSPSKVFMGLGHSVGEGFLIGMEDSWEPVDKWLNHLNPADSVNSGLSENMGNTLNAALIKAMHVLGEDVDMSPVITPVLDLTKLRESASRISGYLPASTTLGHAQSIASTTISEPEISVGTASMGDVKFEQNNYSPKELSTADIYKNTRNQLALAKEELSIP